MFFSFGLLGLGAGFQGDMAHCNAPYLPENQRPTPTAQNHQPNHNPKSKTPMTTVTHAHKTNTQLHHATHTLGWKLLSPLFLLSSALLYPYLTESLLAQSVGFGTSTPDPTARLDIWDSTRGLLIPRLTTQQRNAIQNPAHTLIIFNIDSFCLEVYDTVTHRWYIISCPRLCQPPACTPTISGPTFACTGDTTAYIATGCPNATYQWSVPPGWTVLSGRGSDTLRVIPDTTDGIVSVLLCNPCGCNTPASLPVMADSCNTFCLAIGGPNDDVGYSIIQTKDNGFAIVGRTSSFGQGAYDVYVIKLNAQGNIQWTKTIGGNDWDWGISLIQTPDSSFVISGLTKSFGQDYFDAYLLKLDAQGNLQWTRTLGTTSYQDALHVIQTSDGGYFTAGESYISGTRDVYLVKWDMNGNPQWTRTIGGPNYDKCYWGAIQTTDGGFAVSGVTCSFGQGNCDGYVIKVDSQGNLQWTRAIGGTNNEWLYSIVQTSDSGYLLTGYTTSFGQGNHDVYLVKLDKNGNLQWDQTIGGPESDIGYAIIQTHDGGYAIVGSTTSFGQGGSDVYVIKLDSAGNLEWARTVGGPGNDVGFSITQTNRNEYVITGYTQSFGSGGNDVFVVKLTPQGFLKPCPNGCTIATSGIVSQAYGATSTGGSVASAGILSSGGIPASGGTLTNICP